MLTPLIPQEIYLLERFCSLERLTKLRDTWQAMIGHAEDMLDRYMYRLPHDLRRRPLNEQVDIVWGERVLPNFRSTARLLHDACLKRASGDYEALNRTVAVTGDARGFRDSYDADWMDVVVSDGASPFYALLATATTLADPIDRTTSGIWSPGALTTRYDKVIKEPLAPPPTWPIYRLNPAVRVKSGGRTPQTGIYLPDVDDSFPTLLIKSDDLYAGEANEASIDSGYSPCTWILIERVADTGGGIPGPMDPIAAAVRLRCEAGQPCPHEGFWHTPAKNDSRRFFKSGDIMPAFNSDWGQTIWEWDKDQDA
jgi:hypothetical protein